VSRAVLVEFPANDPAPSGQRPEHHGRLQRPEEWNPMPQVDCKENVKRIPRSTISTANDGILLLAFGICISVLGCEGPKIGWSAESRSPDGKMVATVRAEETSGIGTGDPGTSVYLNWTTGSQSPTIILFLVPKQPGIIKVGMNWLDPTHLELTYSGHAIVDFEAVKCHSVGISVREIPMPNAGTANP
jgi:hypothetical protein